MHKKPYRLQTVLEERGRLKQRSKDHVETCRAQLERAEEELARRKQSLAERRAQQQAARERMLKETKGKTAAHQALRHRTYLAELKRSEQELIALVEQQRAVLERAASELERAMQALIEASKELQVVEKHQENWRQQKRIEEERSEQKLFDEIGSLIHGRRSAK